MKNKIKLFVLVLLCLFFLVGCEQLGELFDIENISIEDETLQEFANIEEFNIEDLELVIKYQNGKISKINVNSNMISEEDLLKLQKPGKHMITVTYQGFETMFEIVLHDGKLDIENSVVVIFMNHDDSVHFTATIDEDGRVKTPKIPDREGFDFIGWFVDEEEFDFSSKVEESVVVYAKWEEKEYNVIVKDCFGNVLAEEKCKYNHPFEVEQFVPDGYIFNSCTFNNQLWDSSVDVIKGDTTLIVNADLIEYEISYDLAGGNGIENLKTQYNVTEEVFLPYPEKEGYLFYGWYIEDLRVDRINKGTTGNIILTASWIEISEENTIYLIEGDHFQFDLSEFGDLLLSVISFTSSDDKVLTINKNGKIMAHKSGEAEVRIKIPVFNLEEVFLVKVMKLKDFNIQIAPGYILENFEVYASQEFTLSTSIDELINLEDFITWDVSDYTMAEIIDGNRIRIFSKLGNFDICLKTLNGDEFIISVNVVEKKK